MRSRIKAIILANSYNSQYKAFIANVSSKIDLVLEDAKHLQSQSGIVRPATHTLLTISFEKELSDFLDWKQKHPLKSFFHESQYCTDISKILRDKNADILSWINQFEVQIQI